MGRRRCCRTGRLGQPRHPGRGLVAGAGRRPAALLTMAIEQPAPAFDELEADRRLTANRRDAAAMLAKADNRMLAGDHRAANAYYRQVLRLAAEGETVGHADARRAETTKQWLAERFRSEEHTSELQSLMRISYAVFCLKQKNKKKATVSAKRHQI